MGLERVIFYFHHFPWPLDQSFSSPETIFQTDDPERKLTSLFKVRQNIETTRTWYKRVSLFFHGIHSYIRSRRSFEKCVAIVLTVLAVVSPRYVNHKPSYELELEDQSMDFTSWLFLLLLLLALALAFWFYLNRSFTGFDRRCIRPSRYSSRERLVAIGLIVLGVLSPLYMNMGTVSELEPDEQSINFGSWLPLLLLILIIAIAFSLCCDGSFTSFDPNWIYRVGGSSAGISLLLFVLAVVLKCKTSGMN